MKTVAEELLSEYTGVVQTDGLQSYGSGNYEHAGCCYNREVPDSDMRS